MLETRVRYKVWLWLSNEFGALDYPIVESIERFDLVVHDHKSRGGLIKNAFAIPD